MIAQIASIWSAWRGLPPSKMTRAYRTLGVEADAVISLIVMLGISFAWSLVVELRSGVRLFGAIRWPNVASNALECVLAISVAVIWLVAYRAVRAMPTLNAVSVAAIGFFAVVVLARLVFSAERRAKPEAAPVGAILAA